MGGGFWMVIRWSMGSSGTVWKQQSIVLPFFVGSLFSVVNNAIQQCVVILQRTRQSVRFEPAETAKSRILRLNSGFDIANGKIQV
jgi:hypothetical protein